MVSYAFDEAERYKRVAHLTDKTLKDAKPADLPVEEEVRVHHQFESGEAETSLLIGVRLSHGYLVVT